MLVKTIHQIYESEFKSLNSKFMAVLFPFKDKSQLKSILESYRKVHPKANHICFAYRIGFQTIEERANDDGEPSGSAGVPILNQLKSNDLTNCLALVIRYFGGTKLGVSGLIEAYKTVTQSCILQAKIVLEEESKQYTLDLS